MKTLVTIVVGALIFVASGCTSTVTLGPKANEASVFGASAGTEGASLTIPLAKATLGPANTETTEEKKK